MREDDRTGTGRGRSRRAFLAASGAAGLAATAGCSSLFRTQPARRAPPLVEDRPDAVYVPTHVEGMETVGTAAQGRYRCALAYTYPHRFWLVTGESTEQVRIRGADDVHLMAMAWDAEAGVAVPGTSPQVTFTGPDGEASSLAPWQMLSQPMGFHFGDNVELGPEGTYDVTVRLAPPSSRWTDGREAGDPVEFSFSFEFSEARVEDVAYTDIPADREGTRGVVDAMTAPSVLASRAPAADEFPLDVLGTGTSGDAKFVVAHADERDALATGSDESYLAVSPRSPHHGYALPAMTLHASVTRDGAVRYDGPLVSTLDADLGVHYSAAVPALAPGDEVTVRVDAPPQVARHEGYETAFRSMDDVTVTV